MTQIFNKSSEKLKRQTLRQNMTSSEVLLWTHLRKKGVEGKRFRRQYGIGGYVVDFYCPKAKLVVEVDGESHLGCDAKAYDQVRDTYMQSLGLCVLRFTNIDIKKNMPIILRSIEDKLLVLKEKGTPSLRRRGNGGG